MSIGRALKGGWHGDRAETLIGGIVVLVGVAVLVATSFNRYDAEAPDGAYQVEAVFNRADGIGVGSEVRVAGIPVGRVVNHTLDDDYRAVVTMRLDLGGQELADDAAAKIQTDGLLGSKYIEVVTAGGGYGTIPSGQRLDYTQDSVIIEDLLSKIVAMAKVKRGLDPNIPASEQEMPARPSILDDDSSAEPDSDDGARSGDAAQRTETPGAGGAIQGQGDAPACACSEEPPVNLFAPWAPGRDGEPRTGPTPTDSGASGTDETPRAAPSPASPSASTNL